MGKLFVAIKTSGGIITDVWKTIKDNGANPSFNNNNNLHIQLSDGTHVCATGELTLLEFQDDHEGREKHNDYVEYHIATSTDSYADVKAKAKTHNK